MFPVLLYSQDSFDFTIAGIPYRIALSVSAGTLLGQAEEIVYKYTDTEDMLSQLLWDLKPMAYLGSALSFYRSDPLSGLGAALDMSVKFGLPLPSGSMEDRDWRNTDPQQLTDFSTHDAYLEGGTWLADLSGGVVIPIKSAAALKALVSVSYMQFSWAGKDGYGNYMSNNWARTDFEGTVITYDQAWLIFSPGIGLYWPLGRALSLDFRFFISPWIYAGDEDNHITTSTRYNDYMGGGLYLEPGLDIAFAPNPFFSLALHGSWRHIAGSRGDTYTYSFKTGSSTHTTGRAGAGFSAFDVGLSCKFALPLGRLGK
jgi:outer membrane protease